MKRVPLLMILAGAGLMVALGLLVMYQFPFDTRDPAPAQPIAFSHKLHAAENEIACLFCHRYAPASSAAGIPEVATCRACHQFIVPDRPEVKKMMAFWDKKEAIPWLRVYSLPDHVYFPHMMHIRAGVVCATCHGEVATMERLGRKATLKMGWCLGCHRQHQASIDCWTCHI